MSKYGSISLKEMHQFAEKIILAYEKKHNIKLSNEQKEQIFGAIMRYRDVLRQMDPAKMAVLLYTFVILQVEKMKVMADPRLAPFYKQLFETPTKNLTPEQRLQQQMIDQLLELNLLPPEVVKHLENVQDQSFQQLNSIDEPSQSQTLDAYIDFVEQEIVYYIGGTSTSPVGSRSLDDPTAPVINEEYERHKAKGTHRVTDEMVVNREVNKALSEAEPEPTQKSSESDEEDQEESHHRKHWKTPRLTMDKHKH